VLYLVVDFHTSHGLWTTLKTSLVSPSNSLIIQLHGSFQDPRQNDSTVSAYLQQAKVLFDELAVTGKPLSMEDFNLYIFRGLRGEFQDLVTILSTIAEPISYTDLYSHLLIDEFLHKASLQPIVTTPLLPTPSQPSSHSISHGLQLTIINKILIAVVLFMEDGRIITVAISFTELTDITLVRILTVMVLVLDSLLDKILGNKTIVLRVPVSGLICGK